jgi:hypothetical protein
MRFEKHYTGKREERFCTMTELALHILDIVQNSISGKASVIYISITESIAGNTYQIEIEDNGIGMDKETVSKVLDPFYTTRTTRKVGLGLPLFKQAVELCDGSFAIESVPGKGTRVKASMLLNHLDRQPLGDIPGVMAQLSSSFPNIDFIYHHKTDVGEYTFDTREIKETLEGMPLSDARIINFIRDMIRENLNEIKITN